MKFIPIPPVLEGVFPEPSMARLLRQKDEEIERLQSEVQKWQYAFSVQSQKLESVLHIPGVHEALAGKETNNE